MLDRLKILVVDDSNDRCKEIIDFLNQEFNHSLHIGIAKNTDMAIEMEEEENFDLIILDLNLPDKDDGANNFGGKKVLDHFKTTSPIIHKIIYLTSTEKTKNDNKDIIDENYFVMYNDEDFSWKPTLLAVIKKRLEELELNDKSINKTYDIAIITALEDELKVCRSAINMEWNKYNPKDDTNVYWTTKIKNKTSKTVNVIATHAHRMGMSTTAVVASKLILKFRPKIIVMLGICAGNKGKVELGEIVVAKKIFDYQAGKIEEEKVKEGNDKIINKEVFKAEYDEKDLDPNYFQILDNLKQDFTQDIRKEWNDMIVVGDKPDMPLPKVHIDSMATGSAVIAKDEIFSEIAKHSRKVIALDMEGYSVFVAAKLLDKNVVPLVIKGVQDFAGKKKNDKYREYASFVAAKFFLKACEDSLIDEIID